MILAIFFVSLLAISAVSAADNATSDVVGVEKTTDEVVSVENDENGNILKKTNEENNALTQANNTETDSQILSGGEGTYNDLRDEIGSGGDINLTKSYYLYDGGDTIVIANPGVINGNGAVIDMNNSVRAFYVESSGVTFKNLTIKNANNRDSGGAIYFNISAVSGTVINCNFIDNLVSYNGGALFFDGFGYIADCNFVNNRVTDSYSSYGGAIHMYSGTVENCNFTNNSAEYSAGAIWFTTKGDVRNCNFDGNSANYAGAIESDNGLCTVSDCNFINCKSYWDGGAIFCSGDGIVENCNFTGNSAKYGGAIVINCAYTVLNCIFINNKVETGGALYVRGDGEINNSTFVNNKADDSGGAIYLVDGNILNCNFTNNSAGFAGGAICFYGNANVINCNFIWNNAVNGSAICFWNTESHTVSNSIFLNNRADATYNGISIEKDGTNIKITFSGGDNLLNAIYSDNEVSFTNVTYLDADGITNTGKSTTKPSRSNKEAGQNITVLAEVNGIPVLIPTKVTDKNGEVVLDIPEGDYIVTVRHYEDSYYTLAEKTISNLTFTVNVTSQATTNRTVNITANSDIYSECVAGNLQFILPNGDRIDADYGGDGLWWAEHTFDNFTTYQVNATYDGLDNVNVSNAIITITRADSKITLDNITLEYGEIRNVTVETVGAAKITASINGANVTVLNNFTIQISDLGIGNYTLTVTTVPDYDHNPVTETAKITVNIAHTEITVDSPTVDIKVFDEVPSGAALTPADAGNLTYKSSNETVVIVKDGKIKALGKGTATVTVSFAGNENYTAAKNMTITVNVDLVDASVSVNNSTLDLVADDNFTIVATTDPAGLNVTFVPDNSGVVSVDENGVVTALKGGTAIISVKVGGDGVYVENSTTVTVTVSKIPAEIKINRPSREMYVGVMGHVAAELIPFKTGNLTYVSNDTGVVSVSSSGVINANGAGTALITVSFNGTDKYAASSSSVNVLVNKAPAGIGANDLKLTVGDKSKLVYVLVPENAQGNISFVSSNPSVANVSSTGEVTAVSVGTANVTITFSGNKNYEKSNKTVKVKVDMANSTLSIGPSVLDYGNSLNITAYTTGAKGITAKINNVDAKVDGFTIEIPVMDVGNYTLTVTTIPDDNYNAVSENATITVRKINSTLTVNDLTFDYTSKGITTATFIGATGIKAEVVNQSEAVVNVYGSNISVSNLNAGTYTLSVTTIADSNHNPVTRTAKVTVNKLKTQITAKSIAATYNVNKNLLITLKDSKGNVLSGVNLTVMLKGTNAYRTDKNGQIKVSTKGLAPKKYTAKITFNANTNYAKTTKSVKVTVKKATPKLSAKAKTFKKSVKTKKYSVILKTNKNKVMKNVKLILKVNKKTYTAKTNKKGVATFKIIKLTKKGKFAAVVKFAGNKYYNAKTVKPKIILK